MKEIKLEYFVYIYNINTGNFEKFNVFNSSRFYRGLITLKNTMKKEDIDFPTFSEMLMKEVRYAFCGRSEYEINLVDLFCTIDKDEIKRISGMTTEKLRTPVRLSSCKKISAYEQISINEDIFTKYVWDNLNLIKPTKRK